MKKTYCNPEIEEVKIDLSIATENTLVSGGGNDGDEDFNNHNDFE